MLKDRDGQACLLELSEHANPWSNTKTQCNLLSWWDVGGNEGPLQGMNGKSYIGFLDHSRITLRDRVHWPRYSLWKDRVWLLQFITGESFERHFMLTHEITEAKVQRIFVWFFRGNIGPDEAAAFRSACAERLQQGLHARSSNQCRTQISTQFGAKLGFPNLTNSWAVCFGMWRTNFLSHPKCVEALES